MAKISVVGPRESVQCYLAAGFSVYFAADAKSAAEEIDRAANDGAAVIFVSPEFADGLADKMAEYAYRVFPAVTLLPQKTDGDDPGTLLMKRAVERAVGADIIYKEQNL